MRITLKIHLHIGDNRSLRRGEFHVRKEDDIPKLAHDWIRRIIFEIGYRKTEIEKVTWNEENDITDKVKELFMPSLPPDNLPF